MKIYKKTVEVGEYKFTVALDRDIVCDSFEQFPDLMEFVISNADTDPNELITKAIKQKNLRMVLDTNEKIVEMVKYAFPKMLKKAASFGEECKASASEILDYIDDNEVTDDFSSAMFEFICSGFTQDTTEKKPKVKFKMI